MTELFPERNEIGGNHTDHRHGCVLEDENTPCRRG
ncbi:MAG: galactokinase family protein [Oscillospiraceae bacterium]|nr:galactokinase family protein [Oscillospiraceae bacterium]